MILEQGPESQEVVLQGVVFAVVKNGKILLEERTDSLDKYHGYTIILGGRIGEGETSNQALYRELSEECGITPKSLVLLGSFDSEEADGVHNMRYIFLIRDFEGEVENKERSKSRHLWVNLDEAREVCKHPVSQRILDMVENYLNPIDRQSKTD